MMEQRSLEVTLLSAEDLKNVKHFGKMHTYAVAWIDPYVKFTSKIDKQGGIAPVWNEKFSFTVPEVIFQQPNAKLAVEILCHGMFSNKSVGVASIPLADIMKGASGRANEPQFLSYQVRRRSGPFQGVLNLSVIMGEKTTVDTSRYNGATSTSGEPVMAFPPGYQQQAGGYRPQYQPQYQPQYTPQYAPAYPPQVYPSQQYYPQAQQPPPRRPGMGGMGLGTGLLAGALGGLVIGDMVGEMANDNDGGGYDGSNGGGFDGGGYDGGNDGGYDGGGFDGGF